MPEPAAISIDRLYLIPATTVWQALTDPALVARWWVPTDIRPTVGHRFTLDAGSWGKPSCEVLEVVPERLLRYRFTRRAVVTTVCWELRPVDEGTQMKLTHAGFDLQAPDGQETFDALNNGWPLVLAKLGTVLTSL